MNIDMTSINKKIEAFLNSPAGKKKIAQAVNVKISSIGAEEANAAAQNMISVLRSTAGGYGLPESVAGCFDGLSASAPVKVSDNRYEVSINLGGNLARNSLAPSKYGSVDNIVALFNNGYDAGNYVYPEGESKYTRSRKSRPGLHFMQQAVSNFNSSYGASHNAVATLSGKYT